MPEYVNVHYGDRYYGSIVIINAPGNPAGHISAWELENMGLRCSSMPSLPRTSLDYYPSAPPYQSPHQDVVRLKLTICCDDGKSKLEKALEKLPGVHDVHIHGWANAMVTVTGPAAPEKILKTARKIVKSAQFWTDSDFNTSDNASRASRAHWGRCST